MPLAPRFSPARFRSLSGTIKSVILTSPTAILDRLVHNAHRIELQGASMGKSKNSGARHPVAKRSDAGVLIISDTAAKDQTPTDKRARLCSTWRRKCLGFIPENQP